MTYLFQLKGGNNKSNDMDWARSRGSRSGCPSRSSSPPRRESIVATTADPLASSTPRARRMSRVTRQHSYDDEIKPGGGSTPAAEGGLGLPAPMPRRFVYMYM